VAGVVALGVAGLAVGLTLGVRSGHSAEPTSSAMSPAGQQVETDRAIPPVLPAETALPKTQTPGAGSASDAPPPLSPSPLVHTPRRGHPRPRPGGVATTPGF
jgi:hypothetical protein